MVDVTKKPNDKSILVILDLDETLIHATLYPKNNNWDFEVDNYKVYKRPGLDEFIKELFKHFKVAIWSSASDDYVNEVVKKIIPFRNKLVFVWGRSKCTLQLNYQSIDDLGYVDYYNHLNYVKILKKVKKQGYGLLEKTLIIDDTPGKAKYNYGNAIYPSEFTGDTNDKELALLTRYLLTLKNEENVRVIEKRDWREKVK